MNLLSPVHWICSIVGTREPEEDSGEKRKEERAVEEMEILLGVIEKLHSDICTEQHTKEKM